MTTKCVRMQVETCLALVKSCFNKLIKPVFSPQILRRLYTLLLGLSIPRLSSVSSSSIASDRSHPVFLHNVSNAARILERYYALLQFNFEW